MRIAWPWRTTRKIKMKKSTSDSPEYLAKKAFFDRVLTIYGRHAVMEALENSHLTIHKLHLSTSNKPSAELERITALAQQRGVAIAYCDKATLSRISKNARQDQGVALDVVMENFLALPEFISKNISFRIVALDGVTNPQNLGMIIRSCAAGKVDALLLPTQRNARISPTVVQASVGTVFKLPIVRVSDLAEALTLLRENGATLYALDADASIDYRKADAAKAVFVLGNESEGITDEITALCDEAIAIPMERGVESLNVAVTAALIAYA
jgi:23S rRNA (guanosine2251-2'-O)-methyltransferase